MFDTGATHAFVSASYVEHAKLCVRPPRYAQQVQTASGQTVPLSGQCTFKVQLQEYRGQVTALVLDDMLPGVDLILGDSWLKHHNAQLCYQSKTCTLLQSGKVRTIRLGCDDTTVTPEHTMSNIVQAMMLAHAPPAIISAKQAVKAVKQGAKAFTVIVRPCSESHHAAQTEVQYAANIMMCTQECVRPDTATACSTVAVNQYPAEVQSVLHQYNDVFAEITELPPERNITHTIPLQPGAQPPVTRMYRLSPAELEEVKRQVSDLLRKGFIEPSTSPYGAPVLFVQKKDNTLRMVVDYRQLNKITIKNRYPLPRIEDLFDSLQGARVFSSCDLQSGYNQIRIHPDDVPLTSFRTPLGSYQYKVLCFGLTNAPAVFSKAMYDVFHEYIGKFLCVYLDDILIYSKTVEEHLEHLQLVLELLRKHKLFAKFSKCEFLKSELKFLGHIVSADGLKVDASKVAVVRDWPVPKTVKELRSFLGLANYFRRFVQGYSSLVAPLNRLLQLPVLTAADWHPEHQQAFDGVKHVLTTAPVLTLPDTSMPFEVVSDASVNGTGAVLLQAGRVCAYTSKKFSKAEYNYTTTEQELLGVIHALQEWRCYLEGGPESTLVTDHNPLTYLQDQAQLSRRQVRWSQFLSRFNYKWLYRPGRINVADPLSRSPALCAVLTRAQQLRQEQQEQLQLQEQQQPAQHAQQSPAAQQEAAVVLPAEHATIVTEGQTADAPVAGGGDSELDAPAAARPRRVDNSRTPVEVDKRSRGPLDKGEHHPLVPSIKDGYAVDAYFEDKHSTKGLTRDAQGMWRTPQGQIVVPNVKELKSIILYESHDADYSGHVGMARTQQNIERFFWWPGLHTEVKQYVKTCDACQRNKPSNQKPAGLLQPLPVPEEKWDVVTMDFITSLPMTTSGFDAITVIVDKLTKMCHLAPVTKDISGVEVAKLFVDRVYCLHGLPKIIISDRDTKFTSEFWEQLHAILGTKLKFSTAFHPQTDGQTERMNRVLEDMLRHYIDPSQTDWDQHLSIAEFAINNAYHEGMKATPFWLNNFKHPRTPLSLHLKSSTSVEARHLADRLVDDLKIAKQSLLSAQQRQATHANKRRRKLVFKVGEEVMLSTANIRLKAVGSPKLLPRYVGPFKVTEKLSAVVYRLVLPERWRIHDAFHVSLLKPYHKSDRLQPLPPPLEFDGDDDVFEVERVLLHRDVKRGKRTVREFLLKWKGYGAEHNTWEPERNIINCNEVLEQYWSTTAAVDLKKRMRRGAK
jgi:hypothetical protein